MEYASGAERSYYFHVDHLGLPRAMTSGNGQVVWSATTLPNGEMAETTTPDAATGQTVVTNLRLPGQYDERLLGALGLQGPYYNWNRWYLPSVGRYLELDPIAKAGGFNGYYGPNWYGYAEGNPLRWTDPTGLDETFGYFIWKKNGNWCGGGWSGGWSGKEPPLDSLDDACQGHDTCYDECTGFPKIRANEPMMIKCAQLCDRSFVDDLEKLFGDPRKWPRPPRKGTEEDSRAYCNLAWDVFLCSGHPERCQSPKK